jgi:hypothetical protein
MLMRGSDRSEIGNTANVFIVDTTFQLLNAIEAANSLGLSRNHLIIVNNAGQTSDAYKRIIDEKNWERVSHVSLVIDPGTHPLHRFGSRIAGLARNWYGYYLHFRRMRRAARIARSAGAVNNLFLGHYWADHKAFMRHFANTIEHKTLYILDDGTDVLEINAQRKAGAPGGSAASRPDGGSLLRRLNRHLRDKYWRWDLSEAESVTFFTAFDIDVKAGDRLVKNDYRYLRSLTGAASTTNVIFFLGQCLVEDGYMETNIYLDYLRGVKAHFANEYVQYVPHPRESARTIDAVRELLGFEIRKFDVPIEYQLVTSRELPKMVASFFCSALESCSNIFGDRIRMACFHVRPEHLKCCQDAVAMIYAYFEHRADANFVVIKMDGSQTCP